ncbi:MAG TPA: PIN domain-containing protein [Isosphaeraceae bacterium]|jgi:predicted nucleic acid-binding protein|nr:PIN domain-containing protein [Isosphaeraceae bacterium]
MPGPTAVLDACVLYPAALRDLLMRLALADVFRARWSEAIHDEWTRNLARDRPDLTPAQIGRIRSLMDHHARDSLVAGFDHLIPTIILPDPDDRHVLAAAIEAGAGVIVTYNLDDFPAGLVAGHGVEARHPDRFLVGLLDRDEASVVGVVRRLRQGLRNPPVSAEGYLAKLEQLALPETAARLRGLVDQI